MNKNASRETLNDGQIANAGLSDMVFSDNEEGEAPVIKDHWITFVEDASDLAKCKKCKVNLRTFQEKYSM